MQALMMFFVSRWSTWSFSRPSLQTTVSGLERVATVIAACVQPFRFIYHARQRRLAETAAMHERQMQMLEAVMARAAEQSKHQTDAVVALANSSQAHAETLQKWFALFQANMGEGETHTMRREDEVAEADKREIEALKAKGYPVNATPAEQWAWLQGNPT